MDYIHLLILILLIGIGLYMIIRLDKVKEGYYLADYWKIKECKCIPKYDEFQDQYNNN